MQIYSPLILIIHLHSSTKSTWLNSKQQYINIFWGPISLSEFVESMDFHGTHGISWNPWIIHVSTKFSWNPRSFHGIHELSMDSTKFSWNPRSFHGLHEISMEPTTFSWNPRTFHGLHEVFMESTKFSWIPRNFHGIHEGRGIHENSPRNFHEVRGIHEKANWIVPQVLLNYTF